MRTAAVVGLLALVSSCVSAGTRITEKQLEEIKAGMTPKEVKAILGRPRMDTRHSGGVRHWIYSWASTMVLPFYADTQSGSVSVFFVNGRTPEDPFSMPKGALLANRRSLLSTGKRATEEQLAQIKPGMTPEQVKAILGEPGLDNRHSGKLRQWMYTWVEATGPGLMNRKTKSVSVFFLDGRTSEDPFSRPGTPPQHFTDLRAGMTRPEVRKLHGEPQLVQKKDGVELWYYSEGTMSLVDGQPQWRGKTTTLRFKDGLLVLGDGAKKSRDQ